MDGHEDKDGGVGAGVDVDVDVDEEGAIPRISAMADADLPSIRFAARMRARCLSWPTTGKGG